MEEGSGLATELQKRSGLYPISSWNQGGPRRIRGILWGDHLAFVIPGQVDRIEPRPPPLTAGVGLRLAEIHEDPTIGRPSRRFDQECLGEKPLAAAIGPHHADKELAALDLGEGDEVAAGRPHRRAVAAA